MIRTIVSLDPEDKAWLDRQARQERTPMTRLVRRAIQRMIEDVLSEKILYKQFNAGEIIVVDTEDDPDKPGDKRLTFNAVPGFMPPSAVELAATGVDGDTTPAAE